MKTIIANSVKKSFKMGDIQVRAIQSISLAVEAGEIITILGKSGSGKTTLLNILGGLERPDQGEVYISEKSLYTLKEHQLTAWRSQQIGYIFQTYNLVRELNVLENIRLPMDIAGLPYDPDLEKDLLSMLDLKERSTFYPEQLSGGERQRVAIARAMIRQPAIILADEPSGNIDSEASEKLMDFVQITNQRYGQTYIIVTHDPAWKRIAGRSIYLKDGKITREDCHANGT